MSGPWRCYRRRWHHAGVNESPTGQPTTGTAAPPRRGRQTVADMLRSLAVVGVAVAALVLLLPRPAEPLRQPVDVAGAVEVARTAGLDVAVPAVPEDWRPNDARYRERGPAEVPTFHVGYVTGSGEYAGLEVTDAATPQWLEATTARGTEVGTQVVTGRTWSERLSEDGRRRSLVLDDGQRTTVVTGTATMDELVLLAGLVG